MEIGGAAVMRPNGVILCRTRPLPLGGRYITFRWDGGDMTEIDAELLSDEFGIGIPVLGELFWLGPFLLRAVKYDLIHRRLIAVRERPVKARLIYALYRFTRGVDMAYRQLVITLYVWGLARYDTGRIPSWRDIYGTVRLARWVDKRRDADMARRIERLNKDFRENN